MGWFSKKEKVVETPEQKKKRFLDNQFENLRDGQFFNCQDIFAIFNKKTGNIVSYDDNSMYSSVDKAVEVKKMLDKDGDYIIVKAKRVSFTIV